MIPTFTTDDARFLSNFYPYGKDHKFPHEVIIRHDGIAYDCVENAYQAAKTDNIELRRKIATMNPYDVVAMAKAGNIIAPDEWNAIKCELMYQLVSQKFRNHSPLKQMLLDTGDQYLQEGNDWGDTFWGVCDGIGENHLGKILMRVCDELRSP